MTIAEGSSARFAYKFYTSGTMTTSTEADPATDPGATGGQIIRRVSVSLNTRVNETKSNEILPSKQLRSSRQTSRHVEGNISGELSPGTYFDLIEAVHRDTRAAATTGHSSIIPATGHVRRKLAVERYNADLDRSRLYTELRATGYHLTVPAQGISTFEAMFMGRSRKTLASAAAPYFTAPTAATTTEVCNSLNGSLLLGGVQVGLVTAFDLTCQLASEAPNVLGQSFPPDVLLGTASVTGSMTFLADDTDAAVAALDAESELAAILTLTNATTGGDSIKIELPRLKLTTADEDVRGELSQPITCQWTALEYFGADATLPASTIRITDSAA